MSAKTKLSISPLGDRIVVHPEEREEVTSSGLVLPDTAKEKPQKGTVVAAGPGRTTDEGNVVAMTVSNGDTVIYSKYAGTEYVEDGTEYLIVRESDVLATVG